MGQGQQVWSHHVTVSQLLRDGTHPEAPRYPSVSELPVAIPAAAEDLPVQRQTQRVVSPRSHCLKLHQGPLSAVRVRPRFPHDNLRRK